MRDQDDSRIYDDMTAIALDTLRISKRLREAGFSEPQAEAVTGVLHDAQTVALSDLATKADLIGLKADLDLGLIGLKTELKESIADVRLELSSVKSDVAILKWAIGTVVAGTIALVMKAFFV